MCDSRVAGHLMILCMGSSGGMGDPELQAQHELDTPHMRLQRHTGAGPTTRVGLTDGSDEHGQPSQSCDGVGEVLLGVVQLLDVTADLLHHDFTLLCLATNLIRLHEEVLNHQLCLAEILPAASTLTPSGGPEGGLRSASCFIHHKCHDGESRAAIQQPNLTWYLEDSAGTAWCGLGSCACWERQGP